jgi:hypothetical protein
VKAATIAAAFMGKQDDIGSGESGDYVVITGVAEPDVSARMRLKQADGIALALINKFAHHE